MSKNAAIANKIYSYYNSFSQYSSDVCKESKSDEKTEANSMTAAAEESLQYCTANNLSNRGVENLYHFLVK